MATNAVALDTNAKYGMVANFDGIDALSSFTMECWAKNQSGSIPYSEVLRLMPYDSGAPDSAFASFSTENGTGNEGINFETGYDGGTSADGYTASAYLVVDSWVHIAFLHNSSTKITSIYVNGTQITYNLQNTGVGNLLGHTTSNLYLSSSASNFGSVGGFIRIWNYIRSVPQLNQNKNNHLQTGKNNGLIVNLKFSEGSGTTIANEANLNYPCTLYGSPSWETGPDVSELSSIIIPEPFSKKLRPSIFVPGLAR